MKKKLTVKKSKKSRSSSLDFGVKIKLKVSVSEKERETKSVQSRRRQEEWGPRLVSNLTYLAPPVSLYSTPSPPPLTRIPILRSLAFPLSLSLMMMLCPNFDREDGLETVLEVPIPEEVLKSYNGGNNNGRSWQNMKTWMRCNVERSSPPSSFLGGRQAELQLLLGVVGAPLTPLPIRGDHYLNRNIKDHPIEASMAKYIVQQYVAATGGEKILGSINSMYAIGKVTMSASEFQSGGGRQNSKNKMIKVKRSQYSEVGGFVLWQKRPDLWCLELVVSGCKISAGSDGKVAWRQTPWHQSHASRGPPRPLRRSLQGLDPRATANLFSSAICDGERTINDEDCFLLKLEAEPSALRARSGNNVEIIRHTVWGYFSQRTGLLVQFEDSHLLRIKTSDGDSVYWETTMASLMEDYRLVDGVSIAHCGKTTVSLFRFGHNSESHSRTFMEETWTIEEVDFNIWGLSMDCFLPPGDLKKEGEMCEVTMEKKKHMSPLPQPLTKMSSSKVVAVNLEDDEEEQ